MTALLTSSQLTAIQSLGLQGMTIDVTILPTTFDSGLDLNDDPYGSELDYDSVPGTTVKGWLVGSWQNVRDIGVATVNTTTQYRLRIPVGTTIEQGWTVKINGHEYLVEDAGLDQTWPEWLTCVLKRNT